MSNDQWWHEDAPLSVDDIAPTAQVVAEPPKKMLFQRQQSDTAPRRRQLFQKQSINDFPLATEDDLRQLSSGQQRESPLDRAIPIDDFPPVSAAPSPPPASPLDNAVPIDFGPLASPVY